MRKQQQRFGALGRRSGSGTEAIRSKRYKPSPAKVARRLHLRKLANARSGAQ